MAFCPNCRDEFIEGAARCPDCGAALVPECPPAPEIDMPLTGPGSPWPENWPDTGDGTPEPRAVVLDTLDDRELNIALMALRGYGLPCFAIQSTGAVAMPTVFGRNIYGGKLYVPASLLEDARVLLMPAGRPFEDVGEKEEDT